MPTLCRHLKLRLLASFAVLVFAAACSPRQSVLKWTEEVRLPDQRVVVLEREQRFDESDFVSSYWFEFKHPESGEQVRYENNKEFSTVELYLDRGAVHLVVTPTFATHFYEAGCPNPPYFVFRYENQRWNQVPLMQSSLKKISENVTVDPKRVRGEIKKRDYVIRVDQLLPMSQSVGPASHQVDLSKIGSQIFGCPQRKRYPIN